jgi:hypothetical protein
MHYIVAASEPGGVRVGEAYHVYGHTESGGTTMKRLITLAVIVALAVLSAAA